MLDVRGAGGEGANRRGVGKAPTCSKQANEADAARNLEAAVVQVMVRDPVAGEMQR